MTYRYCRIIIQNGSCNKEEMQGKLDVFLLNNRISQTEYAELTAMLAALN